MTVGELIRELLKLPSHCEIAVNGIAGRAASPEVVRVDQFAFRSEARSGSRISHGGFKDPGNAYLLRPAKEIM